MPVIQKFRAEADMVGEWLLAVAHRWKALLTGPALSLVVLVYSLTTTKPIPPRWYVYTMLVGVPVALYMAWRDEYRKLALAGDLASLHEANTRHANEIARLETQLASKDAAVDALRQQNAQLLQNQPRDIPLEQRARIARRLKEGQPSRVIDGKENHIFWPTCIHPLSNAGDTPHLARAFAEILSTSFSPTVDGESPVVSAYSYDDITGVVLMEPIHDVVREEFEEHRQKCIQLVVDAFAAEGIPIARGYSKFRTTEITLVIGRRAAPAPLHGVQVSQPMTEKRVVN
jgi:hypothetical protein